jgi:hypothetical protein
MNASDRFLRFAAECEVMAKITHSQENKIVWKLAQRWLQFAELMDQQDECVPPKLSETLARDSA